MKKSVGKIIKKNQIKLNAENKKVSLELRKNAIFFRVHSPGQYPFSNASPLLI